MKVNINRTDRAGTLEQEGEPNASPTAQYTMRGADLEAVYRVSHASSFQTVQNLLPRLQSTGYSATGVAATATLDYSLGHSYFGNATSEANLRCYKVTTEPLGQSAAGGDGGITWDQTRLRAYYRSEPIEREIGSLEEESMDPAFEIRNMPHAGLFWDAAGTATPLKPEETPKWIQQLIRWSYTIRGLPGLPSDLLSYQDTINSAAMTSPTYNLTFPIGTVLFRAPHIVPSMGMMGAKLFDVTMEFLAKPEGAATGTWNKEVKAETSTLQTIYKSGGGGAFTRYSEKNLNDLLLSKA